MSNEATPVTQAKIYKKMSDVMKDVKAVTKDQKNIAQGFKFRGIDQFVNALYPALTKHGVFMTPICNYENHELKEVTRSSGKSGVDKHVTLYMSYKFYAEDGSNVTVGPIPAEGLDSGDKATNKALSAALKYALIQTFSVPTEDMAEADLDSPEITAPKKEEAANSAKSTEASKPAAASATEAPRKISSFRKQKTDTAPAMSATTTVSTTATADAGWGDQ